MQIIFMGTPDFAVPALEAIINSPHHEVTAVFTAPPKPRGRGMKIEKTAIHKIAERHNIDIYTPTSLRKDEVIETIQKIAGDIIVVVAYGFIVPSVILESKKYGCLNIHPSKLPKYRGAAPLQRAIIDNEKETAICIMQMDEGLDTGDIILQQIIPIHNRMTTQELHDICSAIGANLLLQTLSNIQSLPRYKQVENEVSYAHKLKKQEGHINWQESAIMIDCKVRGMYPWPGAYFKMNGIVIKIIQSMPLDDEYQHEAIGVILNNNFDISCG